MDTRRALNASTRGRGTTNIETDELKIHNEGTKNATRDLTRRFHSMGFSLPIRISSVCHDLPDGETVTTHWIKPSDWVRLLVRKAPICLFGDCPNTGLKLFGVYINNIIHSMKCTSTTPMICIALSHYLCLGMKGEAPNGETF